MGRTFGGTVSIEAPSDSPKVYEALPGFHWINRVIEGVKTPLYEGENGFTCSKAGAYLAFRIISYSCIPLALNLISLILSVVLVILSIPLAICSTSPLLWCWEHMDGSLNHTIASLYDLTCDLRQITGRACCDPESTYLLI